MADDCVADTRSVDLTVDFGGALSADLILDPDPLNSASVGAAGLFVPVQSPGGWFDANETWTALTWNGTTRIGTISIPGDKRAKYQPGMRFRLTQAATARYFIVHGLKYDPSGNITTVKLFGGFLNTIIGGAITFPGYSVQKNPVGFPPAPSFHWSVEVTDTTDLTVSSPATDNWVAPGSLSLSLDEGRYYVEFEVWLEASDNNSQRCAAQVALSESATAPTIAQLVGGNAVNVNTSSGEHLDAIGGLAYRRTVLVVDAPKTYYLIARGVSGSSLDEIGFYAATEGSDTVIRAISAYR